MSLLNNLLVFHLITANRSRDIMSVTGSTSEMRYLNENELHSFRNVTKFNFFLISVIIVIQYLILRLWNHILSYIPLWWERYMPVMVPLYMSCWEKLLRVCVCVQTILLCIDKCIVVVLITNFNSQLPSSSVHV